jgi:hypothetical protein
VPQINTLARAYAFLLECKEMTWQQLEEVALRPYNCEPSIQPALLRPAWYMMGKKHKFVCDSQWTLVTLYVHAFTSTQPVHSTTPCCSTRKLLAAGQPHVPPLWHGADCPHPAGKAGRCLHHE